MKTPLSPALGEADEQASLWAARLDGGKLDAAARGELETWLGQAPENRALLSRYCQLSTDLEQALAPELAAPPADRGSRRAWLIGAVAAAAAIAVTFTFWRPTASVQQVATVAGGRQTIMLGDRTQVELNARTKLEFRNTGAERRVRLFEGEAFFSVSHDSSRPFFVETPAGSVRVTGTKFNVRAETPADLEVIVAEGSVEMSLPATSPVGAARTALRPGNRGFVRNGALEKELLAGEALDAALAWRTGDLVLSGLTLQQALQRFGRYHNQSFAISSAAAAKLPGGRAKLDDLDGFLDGIRQPLEVQAAREGDLIRIRLVGEP